MKLLYHGPLWAGTTSLQRMDAFSRLNKVELIASNTGDGFSMSPSVWYRIRWKARWPIDAFEENQRLIASVRAHHPDILFVDNSKVIKRSTLREARRLGVSRLVYYSPDDIVARHNLSHPLRLSLPDWDVFFTTKSFNVSELCQRGVRRPILVGNAYAPEVHRPLERVDVGPDFERFDLVFVGTFEKERWKSLNRLARAGFSLVIYGAGWSSKRLAGEVTLRPPVYADEYTRAMHHGRVALCFLRKINRDRVTTRSVEIPAMARTMVAERTDEHDEHFQDGIEYVGFSSDQELVERVRWLLTDEAARHRIANAGRMRCVESGYSTDSRAGFLLSAMTGADPSNAG